MNSQRHQALLTEQQFIDTSSGTKESVRLSSNHSDFWKIWNRCSLLARLATTFDQLYFVIFLKKIEIIFPSTAIVFELILHTLTRLVHSRGVRPGILSVLFFFYFRHGRNTIFDT